LSTKDFQAWGSGFPYCRYFFGTDYTDFADFLVWGEDAVTGSCHLILLLFDLSFKACFSLFPSFPASINKYSDQTRQAGSAYNAPADIVEGVRLSFLQTNCLTLLITPDAYLG